MRGTRAVLVASMALVTCKGGEFGGGTTGGPSGTGGPGGPAATSFTVDLSGAMALVLVSEDDDAARDEHEADDSNLKKIDADGNVESCIEVEEVECDCPSHEDDEGSEGDGSSNGDERKDGAPQCFCPKPQPLPRVSTIGISPLGDVYLHFERPVMFTECPPDVADPWMASSPCTAQIFRVVNRILDGDTFSPDELTISDVVAVDTDHEVNDWQTQGRLFQFDDANNLYYPAHVPGAWKNIVYRYNPDTETRTEVINANICYRDYLVTKAGGVFYTGVTATDGTCNGTSFFRYVTPQNDEGQGSLSEITRDWWQYTYEPIKGDANSRVIFYGPDPATSGIPSWNSACLYVFDPQRSDDKTTAKDERSYSLVDCRSDLWSYVNASDVQPYDAAVAKERCLDDSAFLGGDNISSVEQNGFAVTPNEDGSYATSGQVVVVGRVRVKKPGTWVCNVCMDGEHCDNALAASEDTCEQGHWQDWGQCYSERTGSDCDEPSEGEPPRSVTWTWCKEPSSIGDHWTETYSGLSEINSDRTVELLSDTNEAVVWAKFIEGELYYVSFSTGTYYLKKHEADGNNENNGNKVLLQDIEVYNLEKDVEPGSGRLLFDGLDFSINSYVFGSFDPVAEDQEYKEDVGLTGQLETLLLLYDDQEY